ncbi:MAG: HIT domain-containing protein [Deltaproteobacteria bacterium]|nr:HIT domain-containing protein [Deltaproteobacteria bacterium]
MSGQLEEGEFRNPFALVAQVDWVAHNAHAFAIRDRYPVSPGHTLIVARRVVATWFDATREEQVAMLELIDVVKRALDAELKPDGYNVGFNAGADAGQTVMHLHVHVIPRFHGDMDDPRGGVRHVIPSRGNYLRKVAPLATGGESDPFARHILPLFDRAEDIAIVAAFVQESGLRRIRAALDGALQRGAHVRVITGDYLGITHEGSAHAIEEAHDRAIQGLLSARTRIELRRASCSNVSSSVVIRHTLRAKSASSRRQGRGPGGQSLSREQRAWVRRWVTR